MADNSVFITDIAEGVLKRQLEEVPPWATQKTAQDIEKVLRDTLKLQTKAFTQMAKAANGGLTPEQAKKAADELDKLAEDLKKESSKRKKRAKDDEDEHNKAKKRWKLSEQAYGKMFAMWSALAFAGNKVIETYKQNVKTYDDLTKAGINVVNGFDSVGDGFTALRDLVALTNVRYTELAAALQKYNTAVNAIGLNKFAKTIGMSTKDMQELGFTAKESGELLGSYLETQIGYTDAQSRSTQELTEDLKKYGERVTKLSLITGQARTAIMANIEAISKSNEASILAANVGQEAADATLAFIGSIKNQNLGRSILKMMTDQIKPLNETFMSFQKIGLGGFGQKLLAFTQSLKGLDPAEAAQRMKAFEAQNRAEIEFGKKQANLYSQVPELAGEANKALTAFNEIQQAARSTAALSTKDLERLKKTNEARTRLSNEWEKLQAQLQKTFSMTLPMMNFLASVLSVVNKGFDKVSEFLKENTLKTLWEGLVTSVKGIIAKGFSGIWDDLTTAIGKIFTWENFKGVISDAFEGAKAGFFSLIDTPLNNLVGTILALVGAFASLKATIAAKNWLFGDKKGVASKVAGGAGKAGDGLLGGIGKGLGGLGKGIAGFLGGIGSGAGKLIEGVLTGMAKGLAAMGNPRVLLGTAALVGVASALWISGKALKDFAEIKWDALAKAGVTLVGLIAAAAGAGAVAPLLLVGAAALAAVGASVWVIGKGIQAVGPGIESMAKGIAEFNNIDGNNLINVSKGILALGGALTVFTGLSVVSGIGGIVAGLANGLGKLFGGDMMSQLKAFAGLGDSLMKPANSISLISSSLTTLSDTLKSFSGLDTLKSIVSTINNLDVTKSLAFAAISKLGGNVSLPSVTKPASTGVTKLPAPSTLDSPSKTVLAPDGKSTPPEKASEPIRQAGPGLEKAVGGNDINSILRYQTSLLEQLVQGNDNIVSVNKDILKYTRVKT